MSEPHGTWPIGPKPPLRRFHQARWDEPVIFELSQPGARGVLPPAVEPEIREVVGTRPPRSHPRCAGAAAGPARAPAAPRRAHYARCRRRTSAWI